MSNRTRQPSLGGSSNVPGLSGPLDQYVQVAGTDTLQLPRQPTAVAVKLAIRTQMSGQEYEAIEDAARRSGLAINDFAARLLNAGWRAFQLMGDGQRLTATSPDGRESPLDYRSLGLTPPNPQRHAKTYKV